MGTESSHQQLVGRPPARSCSTAPELGRLGTAPRTVVAKAPAAQPRLAASTRLDPFTKEAASVPQNASPAAVVSTASTRKAGTCSGVAPAAATNAPLSPRVRATEAPVASPNQPRASSGDEQPLMASASASLGTTTSASSSKRRG